LAPKEQLQLKEELAKVRPEQQAKIMTLSNPFIEMGIAQGRESGLAEGMQKGLAEGMQRGVQQGMQQGMQQGRREEAATLVLRQLHRRLGTVEPEEQQHVRGLGLDQLERLGEALLDFETKEDLSIGLSRNT
jgi:flagellar biosynthesis/type III secretory pathway protein FliH